MAGTPSARLTLQWSPLWSRPEPFGWDAICYRCGAILASLHYAASEASGGVSAYVKTLVRPDLVVRPVRDGETGLVCYSLRRRQFTRRAERDRGPVSIGTGVRHTRGWSIAHGPICLHCPARTCGRRQRIDPSATYGPVPGLGVAWPGFVDPNTGADLSGSPDVLNPVPRTPNWDGPSKPLPEELLQRYRMRQERR
jgi:hypothetical protein